MEDCLEGVHFKFVQPTIGLITVCRPAVRNALDPDAMAALSQAVEEATASTGLHALIVTGGGNSFISGGDLRALYHASTESDGLTQHDLMSGILARLAELPIPVIAAIEGAARGGGCEVALACDLRVMAADATLGFAQVKMAVTPGWGGAKRLTDLLGYTRALELLLTGQNLNAEQAERIGLVNRISDPGEALAESLALAELIASQPPLAIRGIKDVLGGHRDLEIDEAKSRERTIFGRLWGTADHAEAATAFLEKRPPSFRGE